VITFTEYAQELSGILREGNISLRLIRHCPSNGLSQLKEMGYNVLPRNVSRSNEPTIYFGDINGLMGGLRVNQENIKEHRDHLRLNDINFNAVKYPQIIDESSLCMFVSPFLRTLESSLEVLASLLRNREHLAVRRSYVTIIIGPFTEFKPRINLDSGNYFKFNSMSRFFYLVENFAHIYGVRSPEIKIYYYNTDDERCHLLPALPSDERHISYLKDLFRRPPYTVNTPHTDDNDLFRWINNVLMSDFNDTNNKVADSVVLNVTKDLCVITHSTRVMTVFGANEKILNASSVCIGTDVSLQKYQDLEFENLKKIPDYVVTGSPDVFVAGILDTKPSNLLDVFSGAVTPGAADAGADDAAGAVEMDLLFRTALSGPLSEGDG